MYDDPLTEDLKRLLGPAHDDLPSDEQYRRIKAAVDFDRFVPSTSLDAPDCDLYNPAIDGYREAGLTWGDGGWEPVDNTTPLRKYPEYLPTDTAIETLIDLGPLLDVGAGNGYWAHVLTENGGECLPVDISPWDVDADEFPTTYTYDDSDDEYAVWAAVREQDAVAAVRAHADRAVVMCHPDGADRWSEDVLAAIDDQPFVFIGEWFPGPDATPMFFRTLATEWTLVDEFPVCDWASMHAHGYVFERQ